jgi:hypothetical protein
MIVAEEQQNLVTKMLHLAGRTDEIHGKIRELQRNLLKVDPLYEIAKKYKLWDRCLHILQSSSADTPRVQREIRKAWNNIFNSAMKRCYDHTNRTTADGRQNPTQNPFMEWIEIRKGLEIGVIETAKALWQQNELHLAVRTSNGSGGRYLFAMLEVAVYFTVNSDSQNDCVGWDDPQRNERYWASSMLLHAGVPLREALDVYTDFLINETMLVETFDVYAKWTTAFHDNGRSIPPPQSWQDHMRMSFLTYLDHVIKEVNKVRAILLHFTMQYFLQR